MDKRGFSLTQLLHELVDSKQRIKRWQDLEQLVVDCCRRQDPKAVHNIETDPDVLLSTGIGIEAKSTKRLSRDINFNSAAPDPNTFYVIVYYQKEQIQNVAIISGQMFQCKEIPEWKKVNTSLQTLSNPYVRARNRVMWQIMSPFEIWNKGNFIVDQLGVVKRY